MSEEEVAAALRSVEDEGDAAAAAALERETAAELAEFSAEPNAAPCGEVEADDEDADAGCAHVVDAAACPEAHTLLCTHTALGASARMLPTWQGGSGVAVMP